MATNRKSTHIVPGFNGGWAVKDEGSVRATRVFETKEEALSWVRKESVKSRSEVVIHKRDGTIASIDAYGRDSRSDRTKGSPQTSSHSYSKSEVHSKTSSRIHSKTSPGPRGRKH